MNEACFHRVRMFAVKLARMIEQPALNLVYFDEASFNLWMRHRKTWGLQGCPVKMVLNKVRGKGSPCSAPSGPTCLGPSS